MKTFKQIMTEGKKRYKEQPGIGKSKYTVSFHDGKKTHKDGSDFFDIKIFKNKPDLKNFVKELESKGYVQESVDLQEAFNKKSAKQFFDQMWAEAKSKSGPEADGMRSVLSAFRSAFLN
jgi:hypothetical protein